MNSILIIFCVSAFLCCATANPQTDELNILPDLLYSAAKNGRAEVVENLLTKDAVHPDTTIKSGNSTLSPLIIAAKYGHYPVVEVLLNHSANINVKNSDGTPVLNVASRRNGNVKVIELLIKRGANVNGLDENRETSLHFAASRGYERNVETLLKNGANINSVNGKDRRTALHTVAALGYKRNLELLIKNGANLDALDADQYTPLQLAVENKKLNVAEILLQNKANPNILGDPDRGNYSALHFAVYDGDRAAVSLLIEHEADVNRKDKDGETPLHWACEQSHPAIVKLLIEKGADVNAVDYVKNGKSTPLHKAVNGADTDERYEVVNLLINAGADINARNVAGKTALEYAKSSRMESLLESHRKKNP